LPHPEILKKIANASEGKVTYEELMRVCGYALRDLTRQDNNAILRGQIYYVDLGQGIGSEQSFIRPCLAISNDVGNKYGSVVGFAPITSKIKDLPTHVTLGMDCGLEKVSQALLEQIRTVDKKRIKEYVGTINEEDMRKINKAIKISMGIYTEEDKLMDVIKNVETNEISSFKQSFNNLLNKFKNRQLEVA
jgi:mRNA interferase MazF